MDTPNTTFARLIGRAPMDARAEAVLAATLSSVAFHAQDAPSLNARRFIERYCPQVETPIDTLAKQGIDGAAIEHLTQAQRDLCLTAAYVLAMFEQHPLPFARLAAIAQALDLNPQRAAHAERVAREHVVERTMQRLYTDGPPAHRARKDAYEQLRALGASDSMILQWEEHFAIATAARPEARPARPSAFDADRHDAFMTRHSPHSDAHRAPSSVGVFGAD